MKVRRNFYDSIAEHYDKIFINSPFYAAQTQFECSLLQTHSSLDGSGLWALDVGCGTGKTSALLLSRGYSVLAIDSSERMLRLAWNNAPPSSRVRLHLARLDARRLSSLKRDFDLIVAYGGIPNHFSKRADWPLFFKSVTRLLSPGGRFLFSYDNGLGLDSILWPMYSIVAPRLFDPRNADLIQRVRNLCSSELRFHRNHWWFQTPCLAHLDTTALRLSYHGYASVQRLLRNNGLFIIDEKGVNMLSNLSPSLLRSAGYLEKATRRGSRVARALIWLDAHCMQWLRPLAAALVLAARRPE